MKELGLIKVLGVFSVFYSSSISFADPAWTKESRSMSSLVGHIDQQHVDVFKEEIRVIIKSFESELGNRRGGSGIGRIQLEIAYLKGLIEIIDKVLTYQQNPNQQAQLQPELEAIARTYGGKMHRIIWSVIHPAPAPAAPVAPQAPQPVGGDE